MFKFIFTFFLFFILNLEGYAMTSIKPCPNRPNCVSSQAQDPDKQMQAWDMDSTTELTKTKLKKVISNLPRTKFIKEKDNYLHFEFKSRIFGFVDDVEFVINEKTKKVHFRSASRWGYSDRGVNRKRMDQIKTLFVN